MSLALQFEVLVAIATICTCGWLYLRKQFCLLPAHKKCDLVEERDTSTWPGCPLNVDEISLYSKQITLPNFTVDHQKLLRQAIVLIIGAGGLGASSIPSLAGVGIGTFILVDFDVVALSNLHRQTLFGTHVLGKYKVECAQAKILSLNPGARVYIHKEPLTPALCDTLFPTTSLVVDCTDNLPSRLLISDAARKYGRVVVTGSALRMQGHVLVYGGNDEGCYRCLLNEQAEDVVFCSGPGKSVEECLKALTNPIKLTTQSCDDTGILGPVPSLIGNLMALECVRILTSGAALAGRFITFDYEHLDRSFLSLKLKPKAGCIVCGMIQDNATPNSVSYRLQDYQRYCNAEIAPTLCVSKCITWESLSSRNLLQTGGSCNIGLWIDVRPLSHSRLFSLTGPSAIKWPSDSLLAAVKAVALTLQTSEQASMSLIEEVGKTRLIQTLGSGQKDIFVYCRSGNASRVIVARLLDLQFVCSHIIRTEALNCHSLQQFCDASIYNVDGGLQKLQTALLAFKNMPVC